MKKITLLSLLACLFFYPKNHAQNLVQVDAVAFLNQLSAPSTQLAEAHQRIYPVKSQSTNPLPFYQKWTSQLEVHVQATQKLNASFYQQYPLGYAPTASTNSSPKANAAQEKAIHAASASLAQKMLSDPAFAQKIASMSEAEQHALIAKELAQQGLKPAIGTPKQTSDAPAGMDKNWAELCANVSQQLSDLSWMQAQEAIESRYETKHSVVQTWADEAIKKLPLVTMGEYGRDHDPAKVKAIQKEALAKHRELAQAMLTEMNPLLLSLRKQYQEKVSALNEAIRSVNFGQNYDFGIFYTQVLQAQGMMLMAQENLMRNEVAVLEKLAYWEDQLMHFGK
jgi:hypothetical protein